MDKVTDDKVSNEVDQLIKDCEDMMTARSVTVERQKSPPLPILVSSARAEPRLTELLEDMDIDLQRRGLSGTIPAHARPKQVAGSAPSVFYVKKRPKVAIGHHRSPSGSGFCPGVIPPPLVPPNSPVTNG